MRNRNIKLNVFLNEREHDLLIEKTNKVRLTQSDFIRKLINDYKYESNSQIDINTINIIIKSVIEDLTKLKVKMQRLAYYQIVEFIDNIIDKLNTIRKKEE